MSAAPDTAHLYAMKTFNPDTHAEAIETIRRSASAWMTLGTLRDALAQHDPALPVVDEQGRGLGYPHSYRGYYDHLALEPRDARTVGDLNDDLNYSEGTAFAGHKGGEYTMAADSPVWVAHEGEADGGPICGVTVLDGHVVVVADPD